MNDEMIFLIQNNDNEGDRTVKVDKERIDKLVDAAVSKVVAREEEREHNRILMAPTEAEIEAGARQLLGMSTKEREDADVEAAADYLLSYSGKEQSSSSQRKSTASQDEIEDGARELLRYMGRDV